MSMSINDQYPTTTVVTDVAGDHVSKSQESSDGDFGAPHCSLLSDSIRLLLEHPSGFEHEVLEPILVALWYPIVSWRASKPSPRLRHPSPARARCTTQLT